MGAYGEVLVPRRIYTHRFISNKWRKQNKRENRRSEKRVYDGVRGAGEFSADLTNLWSGNKRTRQCQKVANSHVHVFLCHLGLHSLLHVHVRVVYVPFQCCLTEMAYLRGPRARLPWLRTKLEWNSGGFFFTNRSKFRHKERRLEKKDEVLRSYV